MSYVNFKAKWLGKSMNYDGSYGAQCVDLIYQYVFEEYGARPVKWGNAIDFARNPNPNFLALFRETSSPSQGDIVVFNSVDSASNHKNGHIGIVDGISGTNVNTLEQNGSTGTGSGTGGNAVRVRSITKSRVAKYYTRKITVPTPTPSHRYAYLVGKTINVQTLYSVYQPNTDTKKPYKAKGGYVVRGVSGRPNRVVINSKANGGLVDLPLATAAGVQYNDWNQVN